MRSLQPTHPTRAPGGLGWTAAADAGRNPAYPKAAPPPANSAGARKHQPALSMEKLCLLKLKDNRSRLFLTIIPLQACTATKILVLETWLLTVPPFGHFSTNAQLFQQRIQQRHRPASCVLHWQKLLGMSVSSRDDCYSLPAQGMIN